MKNKSKTLQYILIAFMLGQLFLNFYLLSTNKTLKKELYEAKENFDALDGFNQVIQYDLTTSRDSVRLLEQRVRSLKNSD